MKIHDSPDELGDWELRQGEDDCSPTRRGTILNSNDLKSSSRRTGDRDERGMYAYCRVAFSACANSMNQTIVLSSSREIDSIN